MAGLLAALILCLMAALPAQAHASLIASEPADGAVLPAPPPRIILTFNEPVSPLVMRLVAPDGTIAVVEATAERESALSVALPSTAQRGTHVLSWRVVSLDGHPVGGTLVYAIGAPSSDPAASAGEGTDPLIPAALWLLKLVLYGGLFIGIGGSVFFAWLDPNAAGGRAAIAAVLAAGGVSAPILIGLQGADALALPLAGLSRLATWQTGLATSFGATAITAALALLAGLVALSTPSRAMARAMSLVGILAAGLALALSGHASSAAPQWLTRPAVLVHAVAVTFWIGSLLPLGAMLSRAEAPEAVLARFSRAIPWAVLALVVSGAVLAVVQVEDPRALLSTAYGRILCAKLVLVGALLAIAAWNRFRLTPAISGGAVEARRVLRRSIMVELALVLVIFGLVASWRFTPPPRALAAASARPVQLHLHALAAMADVTFEPEQPGMVRAGIVLMSGDFGPLDAKEVIVTLENRSAGIEAISRAATKGDDAVWRVDRLPVPVGGRWSVRIEILVNDFEKTFLEGQVDLRPR